MSKSRKFAIDSRRGLKHTPVDNCLNWIKSNDSTLYWFRNSAKTLGFLSFLYETWYCTFRSIQGKMPLTKHKTILYDYWSRYQNIPIIARLRAKEEDLRICKRGRIRFNDISCLPTWHIIIGGFSPTPILITHHIPRIKSSNNPGNTKSSVPASHLRPNICIDGIVWINVSSSPETFILHKIILIGQRLTYFIIIVIQTYRKPYITFSTLN
ncbi:hypothetical protein AGLY_004941 [Aphis glycines]|uniref:Uncharacterized protein n=1 Tax=Aphis glycines TaxID=307491 RepID=A0A6G0TXL9_APHGL|nr:hypothetical protein AGLY_004941 [Aphis glycines]